MAALLLRVVPVGSYAGRAHAVVERSALVNRRNWLLVLSGVFEPLFYLFALGIGFGGIVGDLTGPDGHPISYAAYVAPGLLAASAMNGAVHDSTFNIFLKLKYAKVYDAMLATPLGPMDVAFGEISWSLIRGGIYAAGFLAVMAALGLITSPWAVLALPAALLVACGFAAVGVGVATLLRSWQDFDLILLVVMPMFLFSTTFYPITVYPVYIQVAVQCLPLYHGIELMRQLTAGAVGWSALGHAAYFAAMVLVGGWFATRRFGKLLLT
ncbi:ABC transporter permease [Kutzneria kofuensis]|uniref:Transport permease protein n=1 Tax=Kutzneria kofuensis TaxID=103725 RepID=A0A7W9NFK6_9PSEU|nr:ABC transporter permease [Kutzneria kofuensis]MBB5890795.1 lipooligosaccharide transport system permease protein [Kutzneria kofuensis]